jgi:prepilin-type N-terminal cleavage/methylation domain-containing protein
MGRWKMVLRKGFTLIELMVTIVILAIMFTGLLQMVFLGMEADIAVRNRIFAQNLLSEQVENLRTISPNDPLWGNDGDNNDLDNISNPDFGPDTAFYGEFIFEIMRNVADDFPEQNMRTSRIHILWNRRNQRIFEDVVIWTGR